MQRNNSATKPDNKKRTHSDQRLYIQSSLLVIIFFLIFCLRYATVETRHTHFIDNSINISKSFGFPLYYVHIADLSVASSLFSL